MILRALGRRLPVVVLLVVLPGALAGCGSGDEDVLVARDGAVEGQHAVVQLPDGRLTFTVSDAGRPPTDDLTEGGDVDGEYVGIDWDWEPWGGVPDDLTGFLIAEDVPAEITATVDGEGFGLGDRGDAAGAYVPASEGTTAADVTLSVELDGVTQTVRGDGSDLEAGAAAPLYELDAPARGDRCRVTIATAGVQGAPRCRLGTVRLPYLRDLGWAPEGQEWLVVDLDVRLAQVRRAGGTVAAGDQEESIAIAGSPPDVTLSSRQVAGSLRTQTAFAVPEGERQRIDVLRTVATEDGDVRLRGRLLEPAR